MFLGRTLLSKPRQILIAIRHWDVSADIWGASLRGSPFRVGFKRQKQNTSLGIYLETDPSPEIEVFLFGGQHGAQCCAWTNRIPEGDARASYGENIEANVQNVPRHR